MFEKAAFAVDRDYDDNKMFLKMDELEQDYVIHLKSNRKLLYHNKWIMAAELHNHRKGKVKTNVFCKGKDHEAYLFPCKSTDYCIQKRHLSDTCLWYHRASNDACHE